MPNIDFPLEGSKETGKVLVLVHGAGKQPSDYAAEPLAEIESLLGWRPLCVPVYYADICEIGERIGVAALSPEPQREAQFKRAFVTQVQDDLGTPRQEGEVVSATSLSPQLLLDLIATEVNQISGYLFNPQIYNRIQARMCEGLERAAEQADSLVVVGHSLGSLVAFDALRAIGSRFNVATFFTLGCPLAKLRRLGLRPADLGEITHRCVREWQNWYGLTDPISNALGAEFPRPGYRLRDVFVFIAPFLPASHDYLRNHEVLAGIADALR